MHQNRTIQIDIYLHLLTYHQVTAKHTQFCSFAVIFSPKLSKKRPQNECQNVLQNTQSHEAIIPGFSSICDRPFVSCCLLESLSHAWNENANTCCSRLGGLMARISRLHHSRHESFVENAHLKIYTNTGWNISRTHQLFSDTDNNRTGKGKHTAQYNSNNRAHKLNVTVQCCLQEKAPRYLVNCWTPVSDYYAQSVNIILQCRITGWACTVLQAPRWSDVNSLLQMLHWLPVEQRINYKLAVLTFKTQPTSSPQYLSQHISLHTSACNTRSSSVPLLCIFVELFTRSSPCDPTPSSDSFRWNNLKQKYLRVIKHTKHSREASWCCALNTLSTVEKLHDAVLYTFTIDIGTEIV